MSERKKIFIWTLFDFANTSFSLTIVTFVYAVYFKKVVSQGEPIGDFYWSISTSVAMLVTALISPILGAIADYSAGKKRFLLFFTLMCIVATCSLYMVGEGDIFSGMLIFIIASIGFEAGLVFYDAFLPEITRPKNYGRVSGYGFAAGYFGSIATLIGIYPLLTNNMLKEAFVFSGVFFLIFSMPLFIYLKETRNKSTEKINFLSIGVSRVSFTLHHLKTYKNLAWFLLAYFFYIEGVNTVIFFSGNYASTTLGFTETELLFFFLAVQTTAIVGSVFLGIISDRIGHARTIIISLVMWLFTVALAAYTTDKNGFYLVGLLAGAAMGSSQSSSRSLMSKLTPPDKKTEFFGFYSFFGKSSAIVGPLVFGYLSYATGDQRIAILSLSFFFIVGLFLLLKVKEDRPEPEN